MNERYYSLFGRDPAEDESAFRSYMKVRFEYVLGLPEPQISEETATEIRSRFNEIRERFLSCA